MSQLILISLSVLAALQYCCSSPYRKHNSHHNLDWHEGRTNLNNYNFEMHDSNCSPQVQQHHHVAYGSSLNQQQYPLPTSNMPHVSLLNRMSQTPPDGYHRSDYLNRNQNPGHQKVQNELYADDTADDSDLETEVQHAARTILNAPTNCKQTNFKGKCIKY